MDLNDANNNGKNPNPYDKPGFKMGHILDIDMLTNYVTLVDAMKVIKDFSKAHRDHLPIIITIQPRNADIDIPKEISSFMNVDLTPKIEDTMEKQLQALEKEISGLFDDDGYLY